MGMRTSKVWAAAWIVAAGLFGGAAWRAGGEPTARAGGGAAQQTAADYNKGKGKPDARAQFAEGEAALKSGDLDAAEAAFRKVVAIDPRSGAAYSNLGVIAMRRKAWNEALTFLKKAAKLAPNVSGIRLNIGLVRFRQGDYGAAIPEFSSVLRDQPDSEQARYLLGLCDLFAERYGDAVSALEPLWPQKANDFMYLYVLSLAADAAAQKELGERAMVRLVEVAGDSPEFHLMLGKAYLNREETQKAVIELQRAASINPNLPFVHFNLGIAYVRAGDNTRAEEEFRRDINIEPDLPEPYQLLGEFYLRAGKDDEAEKLFQEALQRNPKMPDSLSGLAKIYLRKEKYQQALAAVDSALRITPRAERLHFLRGRVLTKLGRREEAEKELTAAAQMRNAAVEKDREADALGEGRIPNPELKQPPQ
jgi:tetratricopeptide (TPR) repeat protein